MGPIIIYLPTSRRIRWINFYHRQACLKPNFCLVFGMCSMQFTHIESRWKLFQLFIALGEKVWPCFVDPSSKIQSRVKSADIFLHTIVLISSNSIQQVWKVLGNFQAALFGIATKWRCYIGLLLTPQLEINLWIINICMFITENHSSKGFWEWSLPHESIYIEHIFFNIFFWILTIFCHKFALLFTNISLLGPKELTKSNSIYFE